MTRDHRQRRQQRHRLHFHHVGADARHRPAREIAVPDAGSIREENHVHLATLRHLSVAHIMLDIQQSIGWNVRVAPGAGMITITSDRHAKAHHSRCHRFLSTN
jgi:hypothetical protein